MQFHNRSSQISSGFYISQPKILFEIRFIFTELLRNKSVIAFLKRGVSIRHAYYKYEALFPLLWSLWCTAIIYIL